MPVVDAADHSSKPTDQNGDKNVDQTKKNSIKTDERMRSEVDGNSNKSWWEAVAKKQAAILPALAIEGHVADTSVNPANVKNPTDASVNPANVKNPTDASGVRTTGTTSSDASTQPAPPKLDADTVKKYADELHKAINRDSNGVLGIGGGDDPDNKKITDLLDSLTATDRKAIEDAYVNADGNKKHKSLRDELKSNLDGDDWRKTEAILNRRDGRTNDAGNLMVALSAINDNRGDAERRVLETFSTLNKDQQKQLEDDFKHDYGMTVDEALKKYDVSGDAMRAVGFLRKPIEERTAKDIEDFAHFAIDKKNLDYFGIALRGDTPAAKEAREALSKDDDFKKQVNDAFKPHRDGGFLGGLKSIVSDIPGGDVLVGGFNLVEGLAKGDLDFDRLTEGTTIDKLRSAVSSKEIDSKQLQALDILHSGHVSLSTIAADNTGSIFGWFDNKKAIGNAADNATDEEKQLFSRGYEIAKNGGNATTDDDKNALNFYNEIHKAFNNADGGKDSAKWEDKLLNGKDGSIISSIADGDGQNGRFAAVEGLSKTDWEKLKDPKSGPQFRKEIEDYVSKFTDKDETPKLLDLLDKKIAADTFEDSQKINRSLFDVIQQNKGHDFLFIGTDYNGKNVTAAIANLSADESAKYKSDSSFRSDVDKFVNDNLDGTEKAYAKRLLSQVADTGKPPQQDAVTTLLSDKVNGVEAKDAIGDVEAALKDDKLRQRLADNKDLTDEEKSVKSVIDGYVKQALLAKFGPAAADGGVQAHENEYLKTVYDTGRLSVEQKAELGLRTKDFFIDAATASPEERQKLYDSKLVNDDDKKLIDTLVKQNGKMDLADEIRSFVLKDGTDVTTFGDKLKALTPDQKQELRDEYTKKFGSTIDDDLLSRVDTADRNNFRTYLTATSVDGRQDFYDNLERALKSESGFSPDGSQEVLDRSLTDQAALLGDFQSKFEKLPADKQEQANKYFSEALKDYQTSKEEFAEKLYQVAVIVGGVAVGVATGGVGLAALATVAVVGAVGRVALKKAIEGNDYDLSLGNVLKDGAIGAITAGVSVVGPETIGAFAGVGTVAAERFATVAGEQLVEQGLKQGGKEIIEKEATNLIAHAVVRGEPISEQAISQVIDKAAANGISETQRTALEGALRTSLEDSGRSVSEDVIKSSLTATARQAAAVGTIGGTANTLIEGSVGLANGNLDISNLPKAFATGFAIGSTLSVGFEAFSHGAAHFRSGGPEVPAGTSEHLDLNFTKAEDGSINVTAPDGKDIDVIVKVNGEEQTIHVDSKGTKLPDGAQEIGIKNAEIKDTQIQDLQPSPPPDLNMPSTPPEHLRQPGDPFVEGKPEGMIRFYHVGDENYDLINLQGYFYPTNSKLTNVDAPVKVHVDIENAEALRNVQKVLIPALEKDPELQRLVGGWKTIDPLKGFGDGAGLGTGQGSKGFTIYADNAADAQLIAKRVDQILSDEGLSLKTPHESGNVDAILPGGKSNRVGIVRDTFDRSVDSTGAQPLAAIDASVQRSIDGGTRLSDQALRDVEQSVGLKPNTLAYDSEGKLTLKLSAGSQDAYHGGVYATEANTSKEFGKLGDRRGLYALYDKYGADPAAVAAEKPPEANPANLTNDTNLTNKTTDTPNADDAVDPKNTTRVNGQSLPVNEVVTIGRDANSFIPIDSAATKVSRNHAVLYSDAYGRTYIADNGSTNGTFVNGQRLAGKNPDGSVNWKLLEPSDKVTLGSPADSTPLSILRPGQIETPKSAPQVAPIDEFGSSPMFRSRLDNAYNSISPAEQALLEKEGYRIAAGTHVTQFFPHLANEVPRGYPSGSTLDSAAGITDAANKRIIIPEFVKSGNQFHTSTQAENYLRHEVGHVVDKGLNNFSHSPEFAEAYARDVAQLRNSGENLSARARYLLQDGVAGQEEAFAEQYSIARGGGESGLSNAEIVRLFPNTWRLVQSRLQHLNTYGV